MICLTGDVHHMSLRTKDQRYLKGTELETALDYAKIAKRYNLKVTLFVTGKTLFEEREQAEKLLSLENVELGGHTFATYRPKWFYALSTKLLKLSNGPAFWQNRDIVKTITAFETCLGVRIISWRDHGYRQDRNTLRLLGQNNIRYVSNTIDFEALHPVYNNHMISVPINTLPDHDYMYHGWLTPSSALSHPGYRYRSMYSVKEWLEKVQAQVEQIVSQGGLATLLVHPACAEVADQFESFEILCQYLSSFRSIWISEAMISNRE